MRFKRQHPVANMRDAAFEAAKPAHSRMQKELALFRNDDYTDKSTWVNRLKRAVKKSLNPQARAAVHRLIPVFTESMTKLNITPSRTDANEIEWDAAEELEAHLATVESLDSESDQLKDLVLHNQAIGNCISKIYYDETTKLVRSVTIDPTRFAPAPNATRSDFHACPYVTHTVYKSPQYAKRNYPGCIIDHDGPVRIDEVYMTIERAMDLKLPMADKDSYLALAVLINDMLYRVWYDPFYYPSFPFAHWKGYSDLLLDGRATGFWGYGLGELLEPMQRLLDEFLSAYIWSARNLATGRIAARAGALDQDKLSNSSGEVVTVDPAGKYEGKAIGDIIQMMNSPEPPVSLLNMVQLVKNAIQEETPSLSDVFVGKSPGGNASGRAINSLQGASLNQLSDNLRDMQHFRERRARIKLVFMQQFNEPSDPRLQKMGYNLKRLSQDAKLLAFLISSLDVGSFPQSLQGKIQVLLVMAQLGYKLSSEKTMGFLGLDEGYGLTDSDFEPIPVAPPGGGQAPVE